jgi:hypothetical protein
MQGTLTLTPAQSETWILGGAAAQAVEEAIAEQFQSSPRLTVLTVLLDTGEVAYTLMQWGQS